jgi:hypothetical protein
MSRPYPWQQYYEAAILETDRSRLPALIKVAQHAINSRIQQIGSDHQGTTEEREAIADALAGIRILQGELP